jgi:hypothetical protein
MLWIAFVTFVLVAITVAIHAVGLSLLLSSMLGPRRPPVTRAWPIAWTTAAPSRVRILFFRSHVHDHRLWRSGIAEALAVDRSGRSRDGHSDVWPVHGFLLRRCSQDSPPESRNRIQVTP